MLVAIVRRAERYIFKTRVVANEKKNSYNPESTCAVIDAYIATLDVTRTHLVRLSLTFE